MVELLALANMESEDKELVPEIFPVDARLSMVGSAKSLYTLFSSAVEVAPLKEIIPNTSYVYIEAFEKSAEHVSYVRVSATDGERATAMLDSSVVVNLSGSALVPGKKVLDIIKLASEEVIRIDVIGTTMTIRSGRAVWTVATPPSEASLPEFASVDDIKFIRISRKEILEALELVYPAISKTSARQSLMQVDVANGSVTACDGVRVHRVKVDDLPTTLATTLPLKFVETVIKELKSRTDETVQFGSNDRTVVFHFGKNILMSQRLNFDFPAVNHLMLGPAMSNDELLTVDAKELEGLIKRVRVNADPDFSAVFFVIRKHEGQWKLIVSARDKHGNASQEALPVEFVGHSNTKDFVVSHKYFLEFLDCLDTGEVVLKLGESTKNKRSPIYYESDRFIGAIMQMAPNLIR